jgi:hypothetical protein
MIVERLERRSLAMLATRSRRSAYRRSPQPRALRCWSVAVLRRRENSSGCTGPTGRSSSRLRDGGLGLNGSGHR